MASKGNKAKHPRGRMPRVGRRPAPTHSLTDMIGNPSAVFFVSHSAGKDSQAMYNYVRDLVSSEQIVVVHADLGERMEWGGLIDHIKVTVSPEHPVNVVERVVKQDILARSIEKGKFPDAMNRWCTAQYKRGPIHKFMNAVLKERGAKYAINCMGIRGEESSNRRMGLDKMKWWETGTVDTWGVNKDMTLFHKKAGFTGKGKPCRVNDYDKGTNGKKFTYDWLPIFDWTMEQVFKNIEENGQKPHPAYAAGMTRLSCAICVLASKSDIKTSATLRPRLFEEFVKAEKVMGFTVKQGVSLEEFAGITVGEAYEAEAARVDVLKWAKMPEEAA